MQIARPMPRAPPVTTAARPPKSIAPGGSIGTGKNLPSSQGISHDGTMPALEGTFGTEPPTKSGAAVEPSGPGLPRTAARGPSRRGANKPPRQREDPRTLWGATPRGIIGLPPTVHPGRPHPHQGACGEHGGSPRDVARSVRAADHLVRIFPTD